jgi:ribosomal protein S24E
MELEILEEKENPFFERKELKLRIKHEKAPTPSKQEVKKELASKYSVPEENIILDYILTKKGLNEAIAKAKIYKGKAPQKISKEKVKEEKKEEVKNEAQTSEAK